MPTPSVTCLTGFPTPAGSLSSPLPATPVTPSTVLLTPAVAESVMVFSVPVVVPTVLLSVPVAVLMVLPTAPGARFGGCWPSGFTLTGVFLTVEVFFPAVVGAFTGVAFTGVEVLLTGVLVVVFLTVLADLVTGVSAADLFLTGRGLIVPRGVRVRAGFDTSLTLVLPAVTGVFFTTEVLSSFFAAAGVVVVFVTLDVGVPAALSFLGTLFTGVAAGLVVSVVAADGFLTGAALVAGFTGVAVVDFFAVGPATLEMFPTLDWSAAFCCLI